MAPHAKNVLRHGKGIPPMAVAGLVLLSFFAGSQIRWLLPSDQENIASHNTLHRSNYIEMTKIPVEISTMQKSSVLNSPVHRIPDPVHAVDVIVDERTPSFSNAQGQSTKTKTKPLYKIPNILVFSYKIDLWNRSNYDSWHPAQQRLADNVQHTVKMLPSTRVVFFDDMACEKAIQALAGYSKDDIEILLRGFRNEKDGSMKGDVCRGVYVYVVLKSWIRCVLWQCSNVNC